MIASLLAFVLTTQPVPPLDAAFGRTAAAAQGRVGAAAVVLEGGESAGWSSGYAFPIHGIDTVAIAMAVLRQVDAGALTLEAPVAKDEPGPPPSQRPRHDRAAEGLSLRELVRRAVAASDGTGSDVLLRLAGGPAKVVAYLREIGVSGMVVATPGTPVAKSARALDGSSATPDAAIALLRALHAGPALSAKSRALLLKDMSDATGPSLLAAGLPAGARLARKTGASTTVAGVTAATNEIGIVRLPDGRHLAIAVFVADAAADQAAREGVIASITRAAWEHHTKRQDRAAGSR